MSSDTGKSREEILAERQEKKKRKAALKNQPKEKNQSVAKENEIKNVKSSQGSSSGSVVKEKPNAQQKPQSKSETVLNAAETQKKINNFKQKNEKVNSSNEVKKTHKSEVENEIFDTAKLKNSSEVLDNTENNTGKTKAQLKAERRAKQEAERAKKEAEKAKKFEKSQTSAVEKASKPPRKPADVVKAASESPAVPHLSHKVKLFAHLYNATPSEDTVDGSVKVHPSITQLGAQYSSKVVTGANACCLALLNAFKKVIMDFETPPSQEFSRGLEAEITKCMAYLSKCRPVAVSMVNAVKHLKFQVSQCKGNELECKNNISEWIDTYIKEQLEMAAKAICLFVREKISPGDVILTYGCSSLIQQILISVHKEGINFQVIVVDGRPWLEGREMLRRLVSAGIHCKYVFVNGLSFVMPEVTKILLGAHALLANGYVMSRAGSSQIALLAKAYNVPVLVCCETHKFSERVQTDSFVYNELGNPDDLASKKGCLSKELSRWKSVQYLTPLNLTYDVTPPDLVTAVVTEIAVLPCTSVPVILRIKPPEVSC